MMSIQLPTGFTLGRVRRTLGAALTVGVLVVGGGLVADSTPGLVALGDSGASPADSGYPDDLRPGRSGADPTAGSGSANGSDAGTPGGAGSGATGGPGRSGSNHDGDEVRELQDRAALIPAPPPPPVTRPIERVVADGPAIQPPAIQPPAIQAPASPVPGASSSDGTAAYRTAAYTGGDFRAAALAAPAVGPLPGTKVTSGRAAPGGGTSNTLILYDGTGPFAWLGEVYGMSMANLTSHFGSWTAHPVGGYAAGELAGYTAVIYLGSTYDEPVPTAFLDDAYATTKPVTWVYDNIWQLTARNPGFAAKYGFMWKQFDTSAVARVDYHGTDLTRDAGNGGGIMDHVIYDPTRASVVAQAVRADGTSFPWAVRSGNLTYLGEIPFAFMTHDDRYMAFADMLYDALAPAAKVRHRALVRIEDVGPDADPAELRAVADYLFSRRVPFTVAVYPRYRDPNGVNSGGRAEDYTMRQRPLVVSALKYMVSKGGTLLMHGYTHQFSNVANPYDAVSANDFEFYKAHVDAQNFVRFDGPVPGDSGAFATSRLNSGFTEFANAGLARPTMFEFPHYAGSAPDYAAVNTATGTRYDRGLYFANYWKTGTPDYTRIAGQFFPYTVRDIYGSAVVPENIGNVELEASNNNPPHLPAQLVASAKRNLVVRDGTASFFYHPYLGTSYLKQTVEGIQALGYTFVPASAMLAP